jgi:predicted NAD/FAD-binding protein
MRKLQKNSRVAIIGSGISGLSLAYFLKDHAEITLFEKEARLGGHSRTLQVNYEKKQISVDTGFIVFNHKSYPLLAQFFNHLNVKTQKSNMSFSVSIDAGKHEWSANSLDAFFAQRSHVLSPRIWRGIYDVLRFNKFALNIVANNPTMRLQELLDEMKLGIWFRSAYLLPMGGAIWSTSPNQILEFPAKTFVNFFNNHGLLSINDHPEWRTVEGGSIEYVKKISQELNGKIRLNEEVEEVIREPEQILIKTSKGGQYKFDHIVFGCHSDQALHILKEPSKDEQDALKSIPYQINKAILHQDESFMPQRKKCWSSWNVLLNKNTQEQHISLTYWMNRLQNIDERLPLFLTLNPWREIQEKFIFDKYEFAHPVFGPFSDDGKNKFTLLQGEKNTWYCGAYLGNGFHEDGIRSASEIASALEVPLPW